VDRQGRVALQGAAVESEGALWRRYTTGAENSRDANRDTSAEVRLAVAYSERNVVGEVSEPGGMT